MAGKDEPKKRGIFCIETIWYDSDSEDKTSVRPMLEMLQQCFLKVPFIHRIAITREVFVHHLLEWLQCRDKKGKVKYPILYLGYHGESNVLKIGDQKHLPKDEDLTISEICGILFRAREYGNCKDSLIHFASCSTLDAKEDIASFAGKIQASAISGYKESIDWIESAAFELNYLRRLQFGRGQSLTKTVMNDVKNGTKSGLPQLIGGTQAGSFAALGKKLGFQLHIPPG